ncbi:hypothetical protein NUW58_g3838 [Xylaria curta]|uniref:Uncharacterized protein n=1 Tax=Xylaria curta TaxID=42375 RepID=A0ACC1PAL8_9PEZI|nr:hypothetical protein NUW58_g3838 [Xylaria curta]
MEAIAAAGALPGLASATIQLGTATFQFYQQLHSLYKAIKHGENDLNTAARRLDQHGDFIKELRFNFERISDPGVSASTRDLFERYITDSEAEVEEFKNLLDKVGKKHFKRKTLQAVETGSRLRFHERSIQKYCDLLDKQMQRFLFLQSAAQSMRVESTLAEVMETLVEQGVKAVAFYDEQSSSRTNNEEPHSPSGTCSNNTRLSLRGVGRSSHNYRTTPCFQQDLIPDHSSFLRRKVYPTLCGTVTVGTYSNLTRFDDKDCQCYRIWFKPYSWISRALVEWRCLISSAHTIPTLMLSVTTSIICDDPDVLDALGFGSLSTPNPTKIRALLDAGRLRKEHVVVVYEPEDILTRCVDCLVSQHDHGHFEEMEPHPCQRWDSGAHLQHHLTCYNAIALLLSRGFEPTLSSWQR